MRQWFLLKPKERCRLQLPQTTDRRLQEEITVRIPKGRPDRQEIVRAREALTETEGRQETVRVREALTETEDRQETETREDLMETEGKEDPTVTETKVDPTVTETRAEEETARAR